MFEAKQKTILLVEDEGIIALTEAQTLKAFDYNVVVANSGEKAIEFVNRNTEINLILMDIDLGKGIDGTEVAREILQQHELPIVFLSGHTEKEIVRKTEKITSYGYIVKGSNLTILDASIKMAFKLFEANQKTNAVNNKLEALVGAIPDLIVVVDKDGFIWAHAVGPQGTVASHPINSIIGMNLKEVLSAGEYEKHLSLFGKCRETGVMQEHTYRITVNGQEKYIEIRLSRIDNDQILAILRDITERKGTEDELKQSQALLNEMGKLAKIGAWKVDAASGFVQWTDELYRICEVDPSVKMTIDRNMKLYTPASREMMTRIIRRTMETGEPFDLEAEIITEKGNKKLLHLQGKAGYTNGKITHRIGVTQDITELKASESALREFNLRYRAFFEASPDGVVIIDPETQTFAEFNDQACRQLGYSREEFARLKVPDVDYIENPAEVKNRIETVISLGRDDFETFQITKQGEIRNVSVIAQYIDFGGRKFYHCIWRDITNQRQAEQVLKESEEKYRIIFNNEIYAIGIIDYKTLKLLDVNEAYTRVYGYCRKELLSGMTIHDITAQHEESEAATVQAKHEGTIYIPLRYHRKKDGTVFPVEIVAGLYEWKGRKVLFALSHDISDRLEAEKKITTLLEEKNLLLKEVHHRIKNNMSTMLSLLSLQANRLKDPAAVAALKNAQNLMRSMGILYDKLFHSDSLVDMSVLDYFPPLIEEILGILPSNTKVSTEMRINDFVLGVKELSALGIIVNELITNAVKYAFPGRAVGRIRFEASKTRR